MATCEFCNLSDEDKKLQIYENNDWIVCLADQQDYIGRCIVFCKEHCENLSSLSIEQWMSLKKVISSLENMLRYELGATMFNWSCLMNDAYKSNCPGPHVHFHIRPRYAEPIIVNNNKFIDEEFAHHYKNNKATKLSIELTHYLFLELKEKVPLYFVK